MSTQLVLSAPGDWALLRERELRTVVDPIVYRAAELFLRGAPSDPDQRERSWTAIKRHIGALYVFFDLIMVHTQLPVFDYNPSFEGQRPWDPELFSVHPQDSPLLVPVHVSDLAKQEARDAAIELLGRQPQPDKRVARRIRRTLGELDYTWQPHLPDFGKPGDGRYAIAAFRYGGLLFSQYAQMLSEPDAGHDPESQGEHVVPPVRSAAYLAATLPDSGARRVDEAELFDRLRALSRHPNARVLETVIEIPETPTFVPYLLRFEPESPKDMLRIALEQSTTGPVRAYRRWRRLLDKNAARGWQPTEGNGGKHEIDELARQLKGGAGPALTLSPKLKLDLAIPSPSLSVGEIEVAPRGLQGWLWSRLPGRTYRKLLIQMTRSQSGYKDVLLDLERVWTAPVPPSSTGTARTPL